MQTAMAPVSSRFSGLTLALIAFGAALNLVVGQVVTFVRLPVFVDSTGTVLVAVLCGPLAGMATGVVSAIVGGMTVNPYLPYYIPVALTIGAFAGFLARKGLFRSLPRVILGGLFQALISATVAAPITTFLFGGITLAGSSAVVAYLRSTGMTLFKSVFLTGLGAEPVDKVATYVFAYLIVRSLPSRLLLRYPGGSSVTAPR